VAQSPSSEATGATSLNGSGGSARSGSEESGPRDVVALRVARWTASPRSSAIVVAHQPAVAAATTDVATQPGQVGTASAANPAT